jgi:hypothetical protein
MRVPLLVVSFLLLIQTFFALHAGRITSAGFCIGALVYTTLTLWRSYRADAKADHLRGGAVVALVYPDQAARVSDLLTAVDPTCQRVIVLAIDLSSRPSKASAGATLANAERFLHERDTHLIPTLARAVVSFGKPVALMRAAGPDPAVAALGVAAQLHARVLVVLSAEDTSVEEQRRRCALAWESLPAPRPALRVHLVAPGSDAPSIFDLVPGDALAG